MPRSSGYPVDQEDRSGLPECGALQDTAIYLHCGGLGLSTHTKAARDQYGLVLGRNTVSAFFEDAHSTEFLVTALQQFVRRDLPQP